MESNIEELKYPLGKFAAPEIITSETRTEWIQQIGTLPERLEKALAGMTPIQLDTPYRPGGWTARQLVHHIADSHMNAFIRIRLALTETHPTIRPYDEKLWAQLGDAKLPVDSSLSILKGLHHRWIKLLENLSEEQLRRTYFHPESKKSFNVGETIGIYAHHGNHHLAQIVNLKNKKSW